MLDKKKIIIMPALLDHIDLIHEAKRNNYYVISCDNNTYNIGHKHSDEKIHIDLLDVIQILNFAKLNKIHAITTFSTDIGAIPASFIAKKLHLAGSNYEAVKIMASKNLFREFLKNNDFNYPKYQVIKSLNDLEIETIKFPAIIKPVDRAGSKGVGILFSYSDITKRLNNALKHSIEKKVIIEDYIKTQYPQIHGDAIVQNGEIKFICLGDQYFGQGSLAFSPIATVFPTALPEFLTRNIINELTRFITLVNYDNGGLNVELRISESNKLYFIEIAPRFGGNFIPKTISYASNVNMIRNAFLIAVGNRIEIPKNIIVEKTLQFILRSNQEGIYHSYTILNSDSFEILKYYNLKNEGNKISINNGPDNIIAIFIIKPQSHFVITNLINYAENYFKINLM